MTLVVNGQLIMEDREVLTLDEKLIIKEAMKFGKKVLYSFPGFLSGANKVEEGGNL